MRGPVFLIGFPGAGKTTVGRALAATLGVAFFDLDDAIAERAGCAVADFVRGDEPAFRELEQATLRELAQSIGVIATGGGAATHASMAMMRAAGLVIALDVSVETARQRHAAHGHPILTRPLGELAELATQRAESYGQAHVMLPTEGRSVPAIVASCERAVRRWQHVSHPDDVVALLVGERATTIWMAEELDDRAYAGLPACVVAVVDPAVTEQSAAVVRPSTPIISLGTHVQKTWRAAEELSEVLALHIDRGGGVMAIGGGATSDLAGFVAGTLYRGVPFAIVPTTLVAMVDAAIGGKTGIDSSYGKNTTGVFWPPDGVALFPALLATLPATERGAGFGELFKTGLLAGHALWNQVGRAAPWIATGGVPSSDLASAIANAARYKAHVVARDEREQTQLRMRLNLGHTVGHAIEQSHGIAHGIAVGLGLVAAAKVADALAGGRHLRALIHDALASYLPCDLDTYINDDVLLRLGHDKKRRGENISFVVPWAPGHVEVVSLPVKELVTILRST